MHLADFCDIVKAVDPKARIQGRVRAGEIGARVTPSNKESAEKIAKVLSEKDFTTYNEGATLFVAFGGD